MTKHQTFDVWIWRVNALVVHQTGLDLDDFPDVPLFDWYESDGLTPEEAATRTIHYDDEW